MTPEQIAEAGQRLARLITLLPDLRAYVVDNGALHEDDCPADDTCDCEDRKKNLAANFVCSDSIANALALAQQALREWVPREDRGQGEMPPLEVGDWVRFADEWTIVHVSEFDVAALNRADNPLHVRIVETRKANGLVWRR